MKDYGIRDGDGNPIPGLFDVAEVHKPGLRQGFIDHMREASKEWADSE